MNSPDVQLKSTARCVAGLWHRSCAQHAMGEVKCEAALETKAEYIVYSDSSCLMRIQGLADRQKKAVKTIQLAEVLALE